MAEKINIKNKIKLNSSSIFQHFTWQTGTKFAYH